MDLIGSDSDDEGPGLIADEEDVVPTPGIPKHMLAGKKKVRCGVCVCLFLGGGLGRRRYANPRLAIH